MNYAVKVRLIIHFSLHTIQKYTEYLKQIDLIKKSNRLFLNAQKGYSLEICVIEKKQIDQTQRLAKSLSLIIIILLAISGKISAQITQNMYWNFNQSTTSCVTNVLTKSPTNANITGSYSVTSGCNSTTTGTATGGSAFLTVNSAGNALRNSINNTSGSRDFIFNLSGSDLTKLSLFKIYFQFKRSNLANTPQLGVSYSTNGTSYTNFTDLFPTYPTPNTWQEYNVDFSGVAALNSFSLSGIWFKITYSQTGTATTVDIDNFQVQSTIITTPPLCTNPVSPINNATNVAADGSLNWNSAAGASGYRIYLGTDASATNILNGVDLGNVTTYTPASNLNFSTNYYWKIVPYNNHGSASGCSIWSFTTENISYCIPTYSTGTSDGDFISRVQLGAINNITTGSTSPYYNYYSALSTDLTLGSTYTITVGSGTYATGNNISVWIDYDQNGSFTASEKLGNVTPPGNSTSTINFTVPANAVLGTTRMRVREVWSEANMDACTNYTYGETEDYNVKIVPSCVNATLTLNTSNSTQTICENESITNIVFTVGGNATGAGVTGLPSGISGNYNSTSHVYTISGTPALSGTFNYTVTTTGTPSGCSEATMGGTITVGSLPATGEIIPD